MPSRSNWYTVILVCHPKPGQIHADQLLWLKSVSEMSFARFFGSDLIYINNLQLADVRHPQSPEVMYFSNDLSLIERDVIFDSIAISF